MLSPRSRYSNNVIPRSPIATIRDLAVAGRLSACAAEIPWQTPISTATCGDAQTPTEFFLVGRLACRAMKPVSNDRSDSQQGACTASRTGGTYIETCGTVTSTATATVLPPPPRKPQIATDNVGTASRSSVQLTWKDNSNNETGFVIERCDQILRDVRSAKMTVTCRGT